jgi:signal transduction histidine kinase/ActR/RegA family two-component response regulator
MKAPLPANEEQRLEALRRYEILDTMAEQAYDDITLLAAHLAGAPMAVISLIDRDRQWFKSKVGLTASETPRELAFCAHAILTPDTPLIVNDATREERFADNPLVTGNPGIRFYFGAPLVTDDRFALGTLCAIDVTPRTLDPQQVHALSALARQVVRLFELRRNAADLRTAWMERDAHARQLELLRRDLEQARDAAEAANRAKSVFLANMSHDIRTPIAGVLGMSDLLLDSGLSAGQREHVDSIRVSGEALLTLINDILDLSKVEAGKLEIDRYPVTVRPWITDIGRLMGIAATSKGIALETHIDDAVPAAALLDGPRLRQVLVNLLGNAVKFTSVGKVTLRLSATVQDGRADLAFSVRDTGPGILASRRDAIFEAFTQADRSTSRHHGGTGLGLAISRRLVEAMGGTLTLESDEGVGTTFSFTIPADLIDQPQSEPATDPLPDPGGPAAPMTILAAEDNVVIQKVLRSLLTKQGHTVDVVSNGREALEALDRRRYDLVLMDAEMPEVDGWAATAAIREREASGQARLPIVAMTAHAMAGDEARCLAAGMDAYLTKPIRPDHLLAVLRRFSRPART